MKRFTDEELMEGAAGELSGLLLDRRDLIRARNNPVKGARLDGSFRTAEQQALWQIGHAELYGDQGYVPTPLEDESND